LTGTSKSSAISVMVYPSMFIISDYINLFLKNIVHKPQILNECVVEIINVFKKCSRKIKYILDIMLFMYYIYNIRMKERF
jgi:hypothetical protein